MMLSNQLADYAQSAGIGTLDEDLFVRKMPYEPANLLCIYDDAGVVPNGGQAYDMDVFGSKWMARGSYSWASEKILEVHRKIVMFADLDSTEIVIIDTNIDTEPQFAYNDDKGRAVFTAHYLHYCSIGDNAFRTEI